MSSGQEYCVYCDMHVAAVPENRVGPDFSASAVRPPMYAHDGCSQTCRSHPGPLAARRTPQSGR